MRQKQRVFSLFLLSPSSRRAWIEMDCLCPVVLQERVALLTEGVDRNVHRHDIFGQIFSRPPHGGRG